MKTEQFELENEIWKDIVGTNGIYQVSNLGRWRRMHKTRGPYYSIGGLVGGGYLRLEISLNNVIVRKVLMHDLVAETFIRPVDFNKEVVHHKNQNTKDNRLENLKIETIEQHLSHHHQDFKHSQQTKKKISNTMKGIQKDPLSQETKKKISEKKKDYFKDNEHWNKGKQIHSQQFKKKQSERLKGNKINLGRKLSPETIAKRTATRIKNKLNGGGNINAK